MATIDPTPYLCIPEALRFRQLVCGGEESIRQYCQDIAQIGGHRVAQILGTEVMQNSTYTLNNCSFVNVRLPLVFSGYHHHQQHDELDSSSAAAAEAAKSAATVAAAESSSSSSQGKNSKMMTDKKRFNPEDAPTMVRWIIDRALLDFGIPIMTKFHAGAIWIRLSGQIYVELRDFERAAEVLKGLCERFLILS